MKHLPPMPLGYQGTVPFVSEEERNALPALHPNMMPPPGWWRDNEGAILAVLPKADPAYSSPDPGDDRFWLIGFLTVGGIVLAAALFALVLR